MSSESFLSVIVRGRSEDIEVLARCLATFQVDDIALLPQFCDTGPEFIAPGMLQDESKGHFISHALEGFKNLLFLKYLFRHSFNPHLGQRPSPRR